MNVDTAQGDALRQAVGRLRERLEQFRHDSERLVSLLPARLERLEAAIAGLGQKTPANRPSRHAVEECQRRWSSGEPLTKRDARLLAWEPSVATDPRFHAELKARDLTLGAGSIQGLLRSCHLRWQAVKQEPLILLAAEQAIAEYRGTNHILHLWQANVTRLVRNASPHELSKWMCDEAAPPAVAAEHWRLDQASRFFVEAVECACQLSRTSWAWNAATRTYFLDHILAWPMWPLDRLHATVGESILTARADDTNVQDGLKKLIYKDRRIGDPRLAINQLHWVGIGSAAKGRVIQWLSRADIRFFFEHAFQFGDPHGRKPFWLKYVDQVRQSRPLLSRFDADRLRGRTEVDTSSCGRMSGANSAFVLDFDHVLVVEFNNTGACYVYPRNVASSVIADLWDSRPFTESDLKKRELLPTDLEHRIPHFRGWEDNLRRVLARYGVRQP